MSSSSVFLLDTNIFIEAYKRYYAFDIAPSFWQVIKQRAQAGHVISIDRIKNEIDSYGDEDQLKVWVNSEFSEWFVDTDDEITIQEYRRIVGWATSSTHYSDAAKAEFASVADSWLIACAKARGCILVTHELFDANIKRKIPIPNVCQQFGVPYINTFEMLRRLNISLG